MDPMSAAGLGLGITSLVLQLLGGCIKGYEIFLNMVGMPAEFQHLLLRMRLEQIRLLDWAEKVGLLEDRLEQASVTLQLHRKLNNRHTLGNPATVQRLSEDTSTVRGRGSSKDDHLFNLAGQAPIQPLERSPLVAKALKALEKTFQVTKRLQWAIVKQDKFENLVGKLISYNDSMVSLLDRTTIQQLFEMQVQSQLAMLQLSSRVDELKQLALAIQIQTRERIPLPFGIQGENMSVMAKNQPDNKVSFARLATFKAQQTTIDNESLAGSSGAIDQELISFTSTSTTRPLAIYGEQKVWIEWKEYNSDHQLPLWPQMIEDRVKKLAVLLGIEDSPKEFRAPHCLGYFHDNDEDSARYGLVYRNLSEAEPVALLDLIQQGGKPSLLNEWDCHTPYQEASCIFTQSIGSTKIYAVGTFSFSLPGQTPDYSTPTVSGFEYARPDLPEELTEKAV